MRLEGLPRGIENTALLRSWELVDARAVSRRSFTIVSARSSYGAMHLATDPADGDLRRGLDFTGGAAEVALAPRYFRLRTNGDEDAYPREVGVYFEFQGADPDSRDVARPDPATLVPNAANPAQWTADIGALRGKQFFRVRFRFERNLDALDRSLELRFFQLPFRF